jgi:hypothetical protein
MPRLANLAAGARYSTMTVVNFLIFSFWHFQQGKDRFAVR